MWQTVIVVAAVASAVGYAGIRIVEAFRAPHDPCSGCQGCALSKAKRKVEARKKNCEKFGRTK